MAFSRYTVVMTDCLFCNIVSGDIPSETIYENETTYAFLDINPVHIGHTLVVPKVPSPDIFAITKDDWLALMETVHMLAPKIKTATGADGVNIIMNNRSAAGQVITDHAHVHIIPRFSDDGFKGLPQHKEAPDALADMQQKIISLL